MGIPGRPAEPVIRGADSGIGRAKAVAFAREGADVLILYLCDDEDTKETARLVEAAGRKAVFVSGDLSDPAHCREVVNKGIAAQGSIDVLISNAAHQVTFDKCEDISAEEWRKTLATNVDPLCISPRRRCLI
ncbi:SDR family NAD(P)-dependent oxidoreductase [Hephaestia sp. GCM10023244]|uniref:SDR family NAD(P)-dependent oxidoreductase n=1 Tax=unclassified Hephaestia TaxID=2631281 RepID=UPI0020776EDA|nr:SDR family NAD(P)-dependent oxidoreductase [Hephaestia sp. MAHUQ-44]MCM8732557.1 SDR family NAD(P)-dependent oxidoreductase [Hephaestia sp. MAHUQ-44]